MNIGAMLKQVKERNKQAVEAERDNQIPSELPKNVATEGQEGDEQKVMELLEAIEQNGEANGASESIMTAKIAEEMADLDQIIIEKQAEHFGVVMADSFAQRLIDINNPLISEKQAEEMVKAAGEEEYSRWFHAGNALWDGYFAKAAADGADGGEGIVDNGAEATPSAVNADEAAVLAEDLAGYLSSEFGGDEGGEGDGKSASEKQAFKADFAKKIYKYLKGMPEGVGGGVRRVAHRAGDAVYGKPGANIIGRLRANVGNRLIDAGNFASAHKGTVGAGVMGAGALGLGGAGYAGYNKLTSKKQSSDAGSIIDAFASGVITKEAAAEKLLSLRQ